MTSIVTPTLSGQLQTRAFTLVAVALPWTLLAGALLAPLGGGLGPTVRAALFVWATTGVLGLACWEPLYHVLGQARADRDRPEPVPVPLIAAVAEGLVVRLVTATLGPRLPDLAFLLLFTSTWLVELGTRHGPMRVLFVRWRFRGGRLL